MKRKCLNETCLDTQSIKGKSRLGSFHLFGRATPPALGGLLCSDLPPSQPKTADAFFETLDSRFLAVISLMRACLRSAGLPQAACRQRFVRAGELIDLGQHERMSRCPLSSAAPGGSAASRPACSRPRKIAAGRSTRAACPRTADLHTSMSVRCISMSVRTRSSKHDSSRCFCLEASASLRRGAIHKHPDYRVELACWFANWSVWILDRTALLRLIDTSWRISKTAKPPS